LNKGKKMQKPEQTERINWAIVCRSSFEEYLDLLSYLNDLPIRIIYKRKSLGKLWISPENNNSKEA